MQRSACGRREFESGRGCYRVGHLRHRQPICVDVLCKLGFAKLSMTASGSDRPWLPSWRALG